jgi:hypothetical protein
MQFPWLGWLTKPNTYPTTKTPASLRSDYCSASRWNLVRLACGMLFGFVGIARNTSTWRRQRLDCQGPNLHPRFYVTDLPVHRIEESCLISFGASENAMLARCPHQSPAGFLHAAWRMDISCSPNTQLTGLRSGDWPVARFPANRRRRWLRLLVPRVVPAQFSVAFATPRSLLDTAIRSPTLRVGWGLPSWFSDRVKTFVSNISSAKWFRAYLTYGSPCPPHQGPREGPSTRDAAPPISSAP